MVSVYIYLTCSNCGARRRLSNKRVEYTVNAVKQGWGSFGSALYCPECSRTWEQRNGTMRPMADEANTFTVIMGQIFRAKRGSVPT